MSPIDNRSAVELHRSSRLKGRIEAVAIGLIVIAAWVNAFEVAQERLIFKNDLLLPESSTPTLDPTPKPP